MEEKTEILLLLGEFIAELKKINTRLDKIENKFTSIKKELRTTFKNSSAPKTKFTIKRTVIDK